MTKFVRYESGGRIRYGRLQGDIVQPLDGEFGGLKESQDAPIKISDVKLLAPTVPQKIIAVGPNYHAHLKGNPPPPRTFYWLKPASSLLGPGGVIEMPKDVPTVCHESELAVVIGKTAKDVPVDKAKEYIFGYTCINDVTAGFMHNPPEHLASQYFVDGKIYDTFGVIGPVIETELDTRNLNIKCRVNGEVRQDHQTSDQIFTPQELLSRISGVMTLYPGDIIGTGSPPGVAPLADGDIVEVEVEGIGVLRNTVFDRAKHP